jgi:hypothetical protein
MEDLKRTKKSERNLKKTYNSRIWSAILQRIWNLRGSNQEDQAHYPKKNESLIQKKITLPLCHGPYILTCMF